MLSYQTVSGFTLRQWFPNTQTAAKENSSYMYLYFYLPLTDYIKDKGKNVRKAVALFSLYEFS